MSKKPMFMETYGGAEGFLFRVYNAIELELIELRLGNFGKVMKYTKSLVKTTIKGEPRSIMIEPANACNLHCPLCTAPPWLVGRPMKIPNIEEAKIYIDSVKDHTTNIVFYLAGEPLLNKDIFKMIKYAEDNGLKTKISTNATLFNEARVQDLLDSGLSRMIISFDGATKESYEKYRVNSMRKNLQLYSSH